MDHASITEARREFVAFVRGLARQAGIAAGGLVLLALVSLASAEPLRMFFRLLSLVGTGMLVISVLVMVVTFRRARVLAPWTLLFSLAVSLISTLISLWLGGIAPAASEVVLALTAGVLLGGAWSFTTLLWLDGDRVRGRGSPWHLAIWALTFALNQGGAIVTGRAPGAMTLLMLIGAGLTLGHTIGLIVRLGRVDKPAGALAAS